MLLGLVITLTAVPLNVVYGRNPDGALALASVPWLAWLAMAIGFAMAGSAIWLPMRAGMKNLRELEF